MKRITKFFAILLVSVMMFSCGNVTSEQVNETTTGENALTEQANEVKAEVQTDGNIVVAKFIDATSMEAEETYIFETQDGTKIKFNRVLGNAEITEEPLEYAFFDYENMLVNKEFIGQSFEINYRVESDCYNVEGDKIDCNKINTIKKLK